jgi:hypothetical protein
MKQTMVKKYNEKACDPFAMDQVMDYGSAKGFIDDAYEKRKIVRKAVKVCRESNLEGEMMSASYFCAVAKNAMKEYRQAQHLAVRAYHKCMSDIQKFRYTF